LMTLSHTPFLKHVPHAIIVIYGGSGPPGKKADGDVRVHPVAEKRS
jgi:hypothetical protein